MTRARTASYGVAIPPPLDHWIDAVLMLFVSLVQGVATTLRMIFNRNRHDWHTATAREDLPQAKDDIHIQKANTTHGVILGLVPRISVGNPRGFAIDPRETDNRDSRNKPENESAVGATTAVEAGLLVRVPREGGDPVLRAAQTLARTSALTRADQTPAFAGDAVERFVRRTAA